MATKTKPAIAEKPFVTHSVYIFDKPPHDDAALEMDHNALASNESRYYVYSSMPNLFGDDNPSPKYLGYVEVHFGSVSRIFERPWFRKHGAKDSDLVADLNIFEPLDAVPHFKEHGIGGKVLDLILENLDEQGIQWVFCFTAREPMENLLKSRNFEQQGDNWFKEIPQ